MSQNQDEAAPVVIHRVWSDQEASIVVSCLAEYGIEAVTNSAVPHEVLPLTVDGLGAVEVFVAREQAEEAKRLLAEHLELNEQAAPETEGPKG